jgi:hypothetical protein
VLEVISEALEIDAEEVPERPKSPSPETHPKKQRVSDSQGKPKARDYEGLVYSILIIAIREFEVRICVQDAFPEDEEMEMWAEDCWTNACECKGKSYALTTRLRGLVSFLPNMTLHHPDSNPSRSSPMPPQSAAGVRPREPLGWGFWRV